MAGSDEGTADLSASSELRSLIGETVGGLVVESLIGEGGMGAVFRARQPALGMIRAVKVIRTELRTMRQAEKRFRREAQALSRLQHHNIVQVLDFGETDHGWPFITMEYVDGCDLSTQVAQHGPFPLATSLLILRDLASALKYAHEQNVVHRDLKPANVVLRGGDPEQAKIIDFGLVKLVGEQPTQITEDGQMVGSPLYFAPEQARGDEVGAPADIYALAGIAYVLCSGDTVFREQEYSRVVDIVMAHCARKPESLSQRCPSLAVPPRLDRLLLACLAKNPQDRPVAAELAAHFDHLYVEAKAATHPTSTHANDGDSDADDATIRDPGHSGTRRMKWGLPDSHLARSVALASELWEGERVATSQVVSSLRAQLRQVLFDLADLLASASGAGARLLEAIEAIRANEEQLDTLEIERVVLDEELILAESEARAPIGERRRRLVGHIDSLRDEISRQRRQLLLEVLGARTKRDQPLAAILFGEWDLLLARYREARGDER